MRRFLFPALFLVALAWAVPVSADQMGDTRTFQVNEGYDAEGEDEVSATLRALGSRIYLYVDDRHWSQMSQSARVEYASDLQELAAEFDGTIHPRSTSFWGRENDPGVDNDSHVTILLEQLVPGNGGYFETINSYSKSQAPESNAREMFVVAASSVGSRRVIDFTTHEFQHLISFNQKELLQDVSDDIWLNEARSEYNITVAGYAVPYSGSSLQGRASTFQRTPSDSLIEWPNTTDDYAIASIFIHYLADRYGPTMLQSTIHSPARGVRALEAWLTSTGRSEQFGEVFSDWMAAVTLNDDTDARYGYHTAGLDRIHVVPEDELRVSASVRDDVNLRLKEWQPSWTKIEVSGTDLPPALNLEVSGPDVRVDYFLGGTAIADYSGVPQVIPWRVTDDSGAVSIPTSVAGRTLQSVTLTLVHGDPHVTEDDEFPIDSVSVDAWLGEAIGTVATPAPVPSSTELKDGDLIRRPGQKEVYVIWGKYRRFLTPGVLELYGFENRPVVEVPDDVFARYTTSNYIRQVDTEPVYAVWPDGTKHWFNITAAQWDASGRDWNSIFIVNEREVAFYATGADITR
jgi:hypothetical protein